MQESLQYLNQGSLVEALYKSLVAVSVRLYSFIYIKELFNIYLVKQISTILMALIIVCGAVVLVSRVSKTAYEASARQPEKADFFIKSAAMFIALGDMFIGVIIASFFQVAFSDANYQLQEAVESSTIQYHHDLKETSLSEANNNKTE